MVFVFFASLCFGNKFELKTSEFVLIHAEDGFGTITDSPNIVLGSSGVVMHKFENGLDTIVARAVVVEKDGNFAKIRFEVYSDLKQTSFPLLKILPQKGDKVILNFLYNRSLIVVPNKEIYNQVVKYFSNINFIHPDIIGAYLSYEYKPNPSRDDFRKMCARSAAGLIFIAMNNEAVFADCGSFKVLKSFKSGEVSSYQLPFFTRVEDIETVFWKFDGKEINNYDKYYKKLLKE